MSKLVFVKLEVHEWNRAGMELTRNKILYLFSYVYFVFQNEFERHSLDWNILFTFFILTVLTRID